MKPVDEVHEIALEKAKQFTENMHGRFSEFVSDVFLQAYLCKKFTDLYLKWKNKHQMPNAIQLAYDSACYLFESILEHGCKATCNGQNIAQEFSELFKDVSFE